MPIVRPLAVSELVPSSMATPKSARQRQAVVVEQDVRGLHVAVDDAAPVRVVEGGRQGGADRRDSLGRQRPVRRELLGEGAAVDALEDEVRPAVELAVAVDADDPGVVERLEGRHLAGETGPLVVVGVAQELHRDPLAGLVVGALEDVGEGAAPQPVTEAPAAAEELALGGRHGNGAYPVWRPRYPRADVRASRRWWLLSWMANRTRPSTVKRSPVRRVPKRSHWAGSSRRGRAKARATAPSAIPALASSSDRSL